MQDHLVRMSQLDQDTLVTHFTADQDVDPNATVCIFEFGHRVFDGRFAPSRRDHHNPGSNSLVIFDCHKRSSSAAGM
jgi:hypothetical protein